MTVDWTHGREVYRCQPARWLTRARWLLGVALVGELGALAWLWGDPVPLAWAFALGALAWTLLLLMLLRPTSYRVEARGVWQAQGRFGGDLLLWTELTGYQRQPTGALDLHFHHFNGEQHVERTLHIGGLLVGWPELAAKLLAAFGEATDDQPPSTPALLPAATIEGWLGVPPGGQLVVRDPLSDLGTAGVMGLGLLTFGAVAGVLGLWLSEFVAPVWLFVAALPAWAGLYRWLSGLIEASTANSAAALLANGQGLRVVDGSGPHWAAWGALLALDRQDLRWVASTADDSFVINHELPGGQRVVDTLRQVLAARAAGQLADSVGEVPPGAISLTRMGQDDGERGLSLTADGQAQPAGPT